MNFNDLTRKFLMGEWNTKASGLSRARAIKEALESLKPRTIKERQRIELALENLSHLRRGYRKFNEKLNLLEENKEE
jgi:hypothetical protein